MKVSDYLLFKNEKRSDDSDFEEPLQAKTDKGKKKMKVDISQSKSHSEPQRAQHDSSILMKLGALEYRVKKLESVCEGKRDIEAELVSEKQKLSQCTSEREALSITNSDLEGELQVMQRKISRSERKVMQVKDTFKCLICSGIILPCVVSPCCKVVIGCDNCARRWIDENNTCPHCRAQLTTEQCEIIPVIPSLKDALDEENVIDIT